MRRALKWLGWTCVTLFSLPLTALAVWYAIAFLPHLGELQRIAQRGHAAIERVEPTLEPRVLASEGRRSSIRGHAMRQGYVSLAWDQRPGNSGSWHAHNALWYAASWLHFDAA